MPKAKPLISMVAATIGRSQELKRLIDSLCAQGTDCFELIIVDQNDDDRIDRLIAGTPAPFAIEHIRIRPQGVCHARNAGAAVARGDWLLFPDDDCWYPPDFLTRLTALMERSRADIYAGRAVNAAGRTIMGDFPDAPLAINRQTIWNTMIEWMTLFRAETFRAAGGFDPAIGPGSGTPWGAYEIQDLALRCLKNGATGLYDPSLFGHHPEDTSDRSTPENIAKMRRYAQGKGFVMHRHGFPASRFLVELLRPFAGMIVYALTGRGPLASRSTAIWQGRLYGWRGFKPR